MVIRLIISPGGDCVISNFAPLSGSPWRCESLMPWASQAWLLGKPATAEEIGFSDVRISRGMGIRGPRPKPSGPPPEDSDATKCKTKIQGSAKELRGVSGPSNPACQEIPSLVFWCLGTRQLQPVAGVLATAVCIREQQ